MHGCFCGPLVCHSKQRRLAVSRLHAGSHWEGQSRRRKPTTTPRILDHRLRKSISYNCATENKRYEGDGANDPRRDRERNILAALFEVRFIINAIVVVVIIL
jgi:hypothetical protein